MADAATKSDLQAEVDRLREQVVSLGGDPDSASDPNAGIVGNLADVQRFGKLSVDAGKAANWADALVVPASIDNDSGTTTPAQTVSGKDPSEVI